MTNTVVTSKVGRNDLCPCGSGKKFKKCCEGKDARTDLFYAGAWEPPARGDKLQALMRAGKEHWEAERYADAVTCYREIARLQPTKAEAHYDLGLALARCGRLSEAANSLEHAIKLKPSLSQALTQLAYVFEAAGKEFRSAGRLSASWPPRRPPARPPVLCREGSGDGRQARRGGGETAPIGCGRSGARRGPPGLWTAPARSGEVCGSRTGICSNAAESIPSAFEKLAQIRRMTASDRPMIERMLATVSNPRLDIESRVAIEFGLGKAFGDLGEYGELMRHYDEANSLRAGTARLNGQASSRATTTSSAVTTAGCLSGPQEASRDRRRLTRNCRFSSSACEGSALRSQSRSFGTSECGGRRRTAFLERAAASVGTGRD